MAVLTPGLQPDPFVHPQPTSCWNGSSATPPAPARPRCAPGSDGLVEVRGLGRAS